MTPSQYAAFITTVDTTIGAIYSEMDAGSTWKEYAQPYAMSGGSILNFGWTGLLDKPRPWFGSRRILEQTPATYQIEPQPFELTVGQDRFVLEDSDVNAMSIFWRMLPDMARSWRRQPDMECRDLLEGAGIQSTTQRQAGLDQINYFSTSHPISFWNPTFNAGGLFTGGSYCNDFVGPQTIGGTVIGGAIGTQSIASLVAYMKLIPGEDGEALGIVPNTIIIPSTLEVETNFILKAAFLAAPSWGAFAPLTGQVGAADNQMAKMGLRPVINPFLKKTLRFYLADTRYRKPLYWVTRDAPRTVPRIREDDPVVWDSHRYLWGGWDRVAPGWNFSWLMLRSGPTGG